MDRQYERIDCLEMAVEGQGLEVAQAVISTGNGADCDLVGVLGNPATRNAVWVPYGSVIEVDGVEYKIIQGRNEPAHNNIGGTRPFTQSPECLLEASGRIHSMSNFFGKRARIVLLVENDEPVLGEMARENTHGSHETGLVGRILSRVASYFSKG